MAYKKTEWKPRKGVSLNRFEKALESNASVVLHNAPNRVDEPGTPFSVQNMNKIEEGIFEAHEMVAAEEEARILGDTASLTAETGSGTDINTGAVAIAPVRNILQFIWGKIRNVRNVLTNHTSNTSNPHSVTKSQVGLGNVDNTSDANKPISTATQTALNTVNGILNNLIGLPTYNATTHVITFTAHNGATFAIDLPLETLTKDIGYDPATKEIIITKQNNSTIRISIKDLIDIYTGSTGTNIQITVGANNVISATLLNGTVTEAQLNTALQTKINGKQDKLSRTIGGNDNATGTVDDNGGNLSIPVPVTVVAPAASATQITAGTRSLRATLKILIDNIASLFANKADLVNGQVPASQLPSTTGLLAVNKNASLTGDGTASSPLSVIGTQGRNVSNQTLDLDTYFPWNGPSSEIIYSTLDGGTNNIANIPSNISFQLEHKRLRQVSATDYRAVQIFYDRSFNEIIRYNTSGVWTPWTLKRNTPNNQYSVTSGTLGHRIRTNIANTVSGNVKLSLRASYYTTANLMDTDVDFTLNNGVVVASSAKQLNRGQDIPPIIIYLDTDNTWTFWVRHNIRYVHILATCILRSHAATTAAAYSVNALPNTVTNIAHLTTVPVTTATNGYFRIPGSLVYRNQNLETRTLYIDTRHGNDNNTGASRANALKTVAEALLKLGNVPRVDLYIERNITAGTANPNPYDSSLAYTVGDRVTSAGYVYERVAAGTGTTPSVTTTVWKFVPLLDDEITKGVWNNTTDYVPGDTVSRNNGTQILTYVCMLAHTGKQPGNASSLEWALCGIGNPVVQGFTLRHRSAVFLCNMSVTYNAAYPIIITLGSVTLDYNGAVRVVGRLEIAGTLQCNYTSRALVEGAMTARIISANCSDIRFSLTVKSWYYISHGVSSKIKYGSAVTIGPCDTLARHALTCVNASDIIFFGSLTADGNTDLGSNTSRGISCTNGSRIRTYGNITLRSFATGIYVDTGSTIDDFSGTITINKSNHPLSGNTTGIHLLNRSTFVINKGCSITRTLATDILASNGNFVLMDTAAALRDDLSRLTSTNIGHEHNGNVGIELGSTSSPAINRIAHIDFHTGQNVDYDARIEVTEKVAGQSAGAIINFIAREIRVNDKKIAEDFQSVALGTSENVSKFNTATLSQSIDNWLLQIGRKINGLISRHTWKSAWQGLMSSTGALNLATAIPSDCEEILFTSVVTTTSSHPTQSHNIFRKASIIPSTTASNTSRVRLIAADGTGNSYNAVIRFNSWSQIQIVARDNCNLTGIYYR